MGNDKDIIPVIKRRKYLLEILSGVIKLENKNMKNLMKALEGI